MTITEPTAAYDHTERNEPAMRVTRVPVPDEVREPNSIYHRDDRELTCEQPAWGWALPDMFRVLADPGGGHPIPAKPAPDDTLAQLGYWTTLAHLLRYVLGWRNRAKGLLWWMQAGKPTNCDPLRLLAQVYDADGAIPQYLRWRDTLSASSRGNRPPSSRPDPWMLAVNLDGPIAPPKIAVDAGVVIVLDELRGWYRALEERTSTEPCDVVVTPIGRIGHFRYSPWTRLWSCVNEPTHIAGN